MRLHVKRPLQNVKCVQGKETQISSYKSVSRGI